MMRLEDVLSEDKIPATEVERQYYFIDVAKQILEDKGKGSRTQTDLLCQYFRVPDECQRF